MRLSGLGAGWYPWSERVNPQLAGGGPHHRGPPRRVPAPVPSGSRVRMGGEISSVEEVSGGLQVTLGCTFEIEDQPKPACVAEIVFRYYR